MSLEERKEGEIDGGCQRRGYGCDAEDEGNAVLLTLGECRVDIL